MTAYSNFTKDFVSRTQSILDSYSGNYEVTNLINCCLGLVIIPKQKIGQELPDYIFDLEDKKYGITRENIKFEQNGNFRLKNILRHIRNGLSHGRIEQRTTNGEIRGLRIHDKENDCCKENFAIEFTVEEFKNFALAISNLIE